MSYIVAYNSQHKTCKIHESDCSSIRQVVGNNESVYIYSDQKNYTLNTCDDVKKYIDDNNYTDCSCCKKCKPNCCEIIR